MDLIFRKIELELDRLDLLNLDEKARTVDAVISSEFPVERPRGFEILEHTKQMKCILFFTF